MNEIKTKQEEDVLAEERRKMQAEIDQAKKERNRARRTLEQTMRNMYRDGMNFKMIAKLTELPLSKIKEFFNKPENQNIIFCEDVRMQCEIMNEAKKRWQKEAAEKAYAEERRKIQTEIVNSKMKTEKAWKKARNAQAETEKAIRRQEKTICNMHAKGMSFEEIADITEQSLSTIKAFFCRQEDPPYKKPENTPS